MPEVSAPEETFSPTSVTSGGSKPFGINWSTIIISTVVAALLLGGAFALYKVGTKPFEQATTDTKQSSPSAKQASPSAQKDETFDSSLIIKSKSFLDSIGESKNFVILASNNGDNELYYITDKEFSVKSAVKVGKSANCSAADIEALKGCMGNVLITVSPGPGLKYVVVSQSQGDGNTTFIVDE